MPQLAMRDVHPDLERWVADGVGATTAIAAEIVAVTRGRIPAARLAEVAA